MTGKEHLTPIGQKDDCAPQSLPEIEPSSLVTVTITLSHIVTACVMQKHKKSELTVNSLFPNHGLNCLEI